MVKTVIGLNIMTNPWKPIAEAENRKWYMLTDDGTWYSHALRFGKDWLEPDLNGNLRHIPDNFKPKWCWPDSEIPLPPLED